MTSLKTLVFVLALVAVSSSHAAGSRSLVLDIVLRKALERLKPKLKDLEIPKQDLLLNTTGVQVNATFDNGLVKHLDEFVIAKLTTSLIFQKLTNLTITLDKVKLTGLYDLDGNITLPDLGGDIHIFGNGDAKIELKGIFLTIAADFVYENYKFQIPPNGLYGFDLYLRESKFNLTNLMGGGSTGDIVNSIISQNLPDYIQQNKKQIGRFIMERVKLEKLLGGGEKEEVLNKMLSVLIPELVRDYKAPFFEYAKEPIRITINGYLAGINGTSVDTN